MVGPQERRAAITHVMTAHGLGVTRACGLIGMSRSLYRYEAKRPDDEALKARLTALAAQKRRYGYRLRATRSGALQKGKWRKFPSNSCLNKPEKSTLGYYLESI